MEIHTRQLQRTGSELLEPRPQEIFSTVVQIKKSRLEGHDSKRKVQKLERCMGRTMFQNLEVAYRRESGIQEHFQAPVSKPQLYYWMIVCTEKGKHIMVGLGG